MSRDIRTFFNNVAILFKYSTRLEQRKRTRRLFVCLFVCYPLDEDPELELPHRDEEEDDELPKKEDPLLLELDEEPLELEPLELDLLPPLERRPEQAGICQMIVTKTLIKRMRVALLVILCPLSSSSSSSSCCCFKFGVVTRLWSVFLCKVEMVAKAKT